MRQLLCILCSMALASCTWVKDDTDDCPYGFWLRLHYTYNILDVEATPEYVKDAYVYVYDAEGNYVNRIYATHDDLLANDYRVRVEGLSEGDYQFLVWSGIGSSEYTVSGDTRTMDDFRLSLTAAGTSSAVELPALFHGRLSAVHYDDSYAVHDIQLMKNTNQLACLVVSASDQVKVNPDDFTMKLVAANGTMDAYNRLVSDAVTTCEPFLQDSVTFSDADVKRHGAKYSMMTLRLMSDSDSRLILEQKSTGKQVFDISFPEFVGMMGPLYTNMGRPLSVQEYLDRQDFHTIVFFLSADLDRLIHLQVNSWRLRPYNHLKL